MKEKGRETGLAKLQQRIDSLLTQAKENEAIQRRCHEIELALIASNGLSEYLSQVLYTLPKAFHIDAVSLHLHDPEHFIRHLVRADGLADEAGERVIFHDCVSDFLPSARKATLPLLRRYNASRHQGLFGQQELIPGSVAVLPLHRGDRLLGMLNLGSTDPERYTQERATDFLQHLAAIAAVCLENAINHERLRHVGLTDPLTGVRNRRYFDQRALEECRAVLRHGRPLACLFIDLDHFKAINDRYGHHNGDLVLQSTARCITQQIRDSDLLSRYGGEEFVLLLLDSDHDKAMEIAERIRGVVANRAVIVDPATRLQVTVSIGVAVSTGESTVSAEELMTQLLEEADKAVYRAKGAGRNCVRFSA